jgi:hypothetical protein
MEDEASMTVGPVTAALSQMTRMSSARSGTLPSSRLLSTRSHNSRHGGSHAPSLLLLELLCVLLQFSPFCVKAVTVSKTQNLQAANHFVHCVQHPLAYSISLLPMPCSWGICCIVHQ